MENASPNKGDRLRFRLYYRLMDFTLITMAFGFAVYIYTHAIVGVHITKDSNPIFIVASVLTGLSYLIGPVLIAVKSLRDEYADLLWQRTARKVILILALAPLTIWLTVTIAYAAIGGDEPPQVLAWLFEDVSIYTAIIQGWASFTFLFVIVFQFLRWSDSR